jgi:catechol 2,3-dioxygenase-like lactoylglutathione lyase family enzyme
MIRSVHHVQVSIPVGSEDEARAFYCATLGMREIAKPESLRGRGGFWAELDGFQIHFGSEDGVDRSSSKAHIAYLVSDLDQCQIKLAAKGIEVKEGISIPGYVRFEFRDPFGNRVEFLQRIDWTS